MNLFKNKYLFILVAAFLLAGCAYAYQPPGAPVQAPYFDDEAFYPADGRRLALSAWRPDGEPWAVLVSLHGFNDYRNAFREPGEYFAENGILTYAYDQRGFGEDENPGLWAGGDALAADLAAFVSLVKQRHPGVPVFALGESMGAAVILKAFAGRASGPGGLIVTGPAVWGWSEMNALYRATLLASARVAPGLSVGRAPVQKLPSDNVRIMREMAEDPYVLKKTRLDALLGLVHLMEEALTAAPLVEIPTLVLYGEDDYVVPENAVEALEANLKPGVWIERRYRRGRHLLLRDCRRDLVLLDVSRFMADLSAKPELELTEPAPACPKEGGEDEEAKESQPAG